MSEGTTDNGPGMCPAYGCFMPGSIKSGQYWKCSFHHGSTAGEMASITARMANRRAQIEIAMRLAASNYGVAPTAGDRKAAREMGLKGDIERWSASRLGNAMLSRLRTECRQPQHQTSAGPTDLRAAAAGDFGDAE